MDMGETNRRVIEHFRTGGPVPGMNRDRLLLLTTTGRRSATPHTTPMMFHRDGDRLLVIASNNGAPKHPDSYLNLVADPRVTVEIADRRYEADAVPATRRGPGTSLGRPDRRVPVLRRPPGEGRAPHDPGGGARSLEQRRWVRRVGARRRRRTGRCVRSPRVRREARPAAGTERPPVGPRRSPRRPPATRRRRVSALGEDVGGAPEGEVPPGPRSSHAVGSGRGSSQCQPWPRTSERIHADGPNASRRFDHLDVPTRQVPSSGGGEGRTVRRTFRSLGGRAAEWPSPCRNPPPAGGARTEPSVLARR